MHNWPEEAFSPGIIYKYQQHLNQIQAGHTIECPHFQKASQDGQNRAQERRENIINKDTDQR
eukprot:Pgem_evm1s4